MITILDINSEKFSVNGIPYFKNFTPIPILDKLRIVNVYDSKLELVPYTDFSEFTVNGVTYGSVAALQSALLPVLYSRNTLGFEGVIPNEIISVGTITRVGNNITLGVGFSWRINNVVYSNAAPVVINVPDAAASNYRTDKIVANVNNSFTLVSGAESLTISPAPATPPNTVLITSINIFGNTIVEVPQTVDKFVTKISHADLQIYYTGVVDNLPRMNKSKYILYGAMTSIGGFLTASMAPADDQIYNGQFVTLINRSGGTITMLHMAAAGEKKLYFPNGADYLLENNEVARFVFDFAMGVYYFVGYVPKYGVVSITGNVTLNNSHNGKILLLTANATITVPAGLIAKFTCDIDVLEAFTATFVFTGTTVSGNAGLTLAGGKMATLYQRPIANAYRLKGETS